MKQIRDINVHDIITTLISFYIFLPLVGNRSINSFFIIECIVCFICYVLLHIFLKSKLLLGIVGLICIFITYFNIWYDFYMLTLLLLILSSPFLLALLIRKGFLPRIFKFQAYLMEPLVFILSMLILIEIAENVKRSLPVTEEQLVYGLLTTTIFASSIYIIRVLFSFIEELVSGSISIKRGVLKLVIPLGLFIILCFPDLVFSIAVYQLYLSIFSDLNYSEFDIFYYSFSTHFLTPLYEVGEEVKKELGNSIGKGITMAHILTVRIIDITILANIGEVFFKAMGYNSKE